MKYKRCAIIKDIGKSDMFYYVRHRYIGKKIKNIEDLIVRNKEGYYSCQAVFIEKDTISDNWGCFHRVKLEFVDEKECKTCKHKLKCITEGV
jgi:hypothetical protein